MRIGAGLLVALAAMSAGGTPQFAASQAARPSLKTMPQTAPRPRPAKALGDVDGDGRYDIVLGTGPGGPPQVKVFSGASGAVIQAFMAYAASYTGGVRTASGDVDGDGRADVLAGARTGSTHVKVFSGQTGGEIRSFMAFPAAFAGGVSVAAGDVNGDGKADAIVGAGPGGGPHVKAFSGADSAEIRSFFAYETAFAGGVSVAAGDVNGDGTADIVTGAGGPTPHVKVFDGRSGQVLMSMMAFPSGQLAGLAVGDVNGDGRADLVVAQGAVLKVFDGASGAVLRQFTVPGSEAGNLVIKAGDVNGDGRAEVIASTGTGSTRMIRVFNGLTGQPNGVFAG